MSSSETAFKKIIRFGVLCLALLPASIFFLVSYLEVKNIVINDVAVQARRVNDFIKLNPESWGFLRERLQDQLSSVKHGATSSIVLDKTGRVLVVVGSECRAWCLTERLDLNDFGFPVGQIKVSMSVAEKLQITVIFVVLSELLAVFLLFILNRYLLEPLIITKKANNELQNYDSITHLPNRNSVLRQLDEVLQGIRGSTRVGVLMLIDIDRFNVFNDTLGHDCGDQLLVEIAGRLGSSARRGDLLGRLGGDDFLLAFADIDSDLENASKHAERTANSIRRKLSLPYSFSNHSKLLHITVSIGVALITSNVTSAAELLKKAEIALYEAKKRGRNNIQFFSEMAKYSMESRASMEASMRLGLENNEFQLFYQSQNNAQGDIIGVEALMRWISRERVIPPFEFISVAEESDLIFSLGKLAIRQACEQLKSWEKTSLSEIPISVNVSPRQFERNNFSNVVKNIISLTGINPLLLKFEVTESTVIDNLSVVIEQMQDLAAIGVSFSLDDFGTGYSSLQLLKILPINQIKIDRMFVENLTTDPSDFAIVKTITALGDSLGLNVIAEGVETEEQRLILQSLGCTRYQGFLFGRPKPATEWISEPF